MALEIKQYLTRKNAITGLLVVVPIIVSLLLGLITSAQINGWYKTLNKPSWTPPNWLFGPMWAFLYITTAIASAIVYRKWDSNPPRVKNALTFYGIQYVFNILWTPLFFLFHWLEVALVDILILLVLIPITGIKFYRISEIAGLIFIPYFVWVFYATTLTIGFVVLN